MAFRLRRYKQLRTARDRSAAAAKALRPDQREYYEQLLRSWGAVLRRPQSPTYLHWNAEGDALRKTLNNRP